MCSSDLRGPGVSGLLQHRTSAQHGRIRHAQGQVGRPGEGDLRSSRPQAGGGAGKEKTATRAGLHPSGQAGIMKLAGRNGSGLCWGATRRGIARRGSPSRRPRRGSGPNPLSPPLPENSHRTVDPSCLETPRPKGGRNGAGQVMVNCLARPARIPFPAEPIQWARRPVRG